MKQVKPSYSLRSDFIYQNIFYFYAGKVIEKGKWHRPGKFLFRKGFLIR
jgi:hypothetical protein